jgi:hypothetical protein
LIRLTKGKLPDPFYVTLPKVVHPGQAAAFIGCPTPSEKEEAQPGTIVELHGRDASPSSASTELPLRAMVDALPGRCVSAHRT